MKLLVAPLNWGLGHASRCVPLIKNYLEEGHDVVLAGDGESLLLLRKSFPNLRVIDLPALSLRYDENPRQFFFYWRVIPSLLRSAIADFFCLRDILAREHFDMVLSDNRFGLFSREVRCVYLTHQLYPVLPKYLKVFQSFARVIHSCVYRRYSEVWVPDYSSSESNLSGELSHGGKYDTFVKYIGPLSRLTASTDEGNRGDISSNQYSVVALLSGLEPQRGIFEQEIIARYSNTKESVLLVRGKIGEPRLAFKKNNVTIVPNISDSDLCAVLLQSKKIIVRSGYSTIMDLDALNVLNKAEFHPTPGQSEQEYLSMYMAIRNK